MARWIRATARPSRGSVEGAADPSDVRRVTRALARAARKNRVILNAAARTGVGRRRSVNEDCFALAAELGLYQVANGTGGHTAGQLASRVATAATVDALRRVIDADATLIEKLRHCVAAANRGISDEFQEKAELSGMGTRLVSVLAGRGRVALARVGDGRAYWIRGGRIRQRTDDHSLVAELVRRDEISAMAARGHPHRHALTRALGVRRVVKADRAELTPTAGDLIALCSDGLTGLVDDREIAAEVSADSDLERVCVRLIDMAKDAGGEDNAAVALVRWDDEEPECEIPNV